MNPIILQKQVRDNAQDVQNYILDLKQWEKEMKRKEEKLASDSSYSKDKACELIDQEEESTPVVVNRSRDEAYYEKEMGNKFAKQNKWKEALECYTRAVEKYSHDAVFYANRALCHLKLHNPTAAEADCTQSLDLDPEYVKAYQRRATARIELKHYEKAKTDLQKALELDVNNKFIKEQFSKLKENLARIEQVPEKSENIIQGKSSEALNASSANTRGSGDRKHPAFAKGIQRLVLPIAKPPHLRSKKPLKRIEIKEITDTCGDDENVTSVAETIEPVNAVPQTGSNKIAPMNANHEGKVPHAQCLSNEHQSNEKKSENPMEEESSGDIPPCPSSSVQFITAWKAFKNNPERKFQYLKKIPGDKLPTIFRESMESNILSEIITTLEKYFLQHKVAVYPYLKGISQIKRFGALTMFLSKNDKSGLENLLDFCKANNECTEDDIAYLRGKYEL